MTEHTLRTNMPQGTAKKKKKISSFKSTSPLSVGKCDFCNEWFFWTGLSEGLCECFDSFLPCRAHKLLLGLLPSVLPGLQSMPLPSFGTSPPKSGALEDCPFQSHSLPGHVCPSGLLGDFPGGSDSKASAYNAGDPSSIPGSGRSPGEGNGSPLQYSCLENPMDRGAWQATGPGVTKSRTRLSDFTLDPTTQLPGCHPLSLSQATPAFKSLEAGCGKHTPETGCLFCYSKSFVLCFCGISFLFVIVFGMWALAP